MPRAIWSGTISFGLVSVPVRMFPPTESKELRAKSLVENLSERFDPSKYDDTYRKELLDLIRAKAEGQALPEPEAEEEGEVVDLMAALRESVERMKKQRRKPAGRKTS